MPVIVTCHQCGKPIKKSPSHIKTSATGYFFCSTPCLKAWQASKTVLVKCGQCGKEFKRHKNHADRQMLHFCDNKCRGAWVGKTHMGENHPRWNSVLLVNCDQCGSSFRQRSITRLKRNEHNFCSMECSAQWSSEHKTGENNHNWKGGPNDYYGPNWDRQARATRKRDGCKCRHCGMNQKKTKRAFDVHHIVPFRHFGYIRGENDNYKQANDLTNLISLCQQCHAKAEAGQIPIQPTLL